MSNPNAPKNPPAKSNAQDPLQAPQMDASPERFLPETPEHIEALGNEAPPAVAGTPAPNLKGAPKKTGRVVDADLPAGMVRVKLCAHSGWYHPNTSKYHAAGDVIDVTPEQKAMLKGLGLLQPRPMPEDDDDGTITTMDRSSLRR